MRRCPPALAEPHTAIYDWRPYRGFHILRVFAGALRIAGDPDDRVEDILRRIPPSVDTFVFNLDLSYTVRFPQERERLVSELRARGIDVWNANATDMRKSRMQQVCRNTGLPSVSTTRDGDPDEILIVKSDANYAGKAERTLSARQRERLGIPGAVRMFATKDEYRVVRRREVLPEWWENPLLEVERFVSNAENLWYRVRFICDTWVVSETISLSPIKTIENASSERSHIFRRGEAVDLPDRLQEVSGRLIDMLELEYGALDVIVDDGGEMYVVDVNATPGLTVYAEGQLEAFRQAWQERRMSRRLTTI